MIVWLMLLNNCKVYVVVYLYTIVGIPESIDLHQSLTHSYFSQLLCTIEMCYIVVIFSPIQ